MWMSEPLKTPPGQWFGVLFLSLAPVALWSFVLCLTHAVHPAVAVAEQMGQGETFWGAP